MYDGRDNNYIKKVVVSSLFDEIDFGEKWLSIAKNMHLTLWSMQGLFLMMSCNFKGEDFTPRSQRWMQLNLL